MITTLRVTNFALISSLDLNLKSGFSVITGETGSGKSILLGALDLLLGERADFSLIGPDGDKAIVEANAEISNYNLKEFFEINDLDYSDQTIIRREISANGRSRAFINDTPVQLNVLRDLSSRLININSQYNTLELKDREFQLNILDTLANLNTEKAEYTELYKVFQQKLKQLEKLEFELSELLKQRDYNFFQKNELEDLSLEITDYTKIEKELSFAENSEQIGIIINQFVDGLGGEGGALEFLTKVKSELEKFKDIDEDLGDFYSRTTSILIETKELHTDALRYSESIDLDPALKEKLTVQLDKFNHVLRKHHLNNQSELLTLLSKLSIDIENSEVIEAEIALLKDECNRLSEYVRISSENLHEKRESSRQKLENELKVLLSELKLNDTSLYFHLEKKDVPDKNGISELSLKFSANKGIDAIAIEKAASGGELSRVMLALQKLISEKRAMPTVLFDEIDTGVSGDVAQKTGNLLRKMGEKMQLIAITHLPQVAARAEHHFKVEKYNNEARTISAVRLLNDDEHVHEIARLMSGEQVTDAAIVNAKELMNS